MSVCKKSTTKFLFRFFNLSTVILLTWYIKQNKTKKHVNKHSRWWWSEWNCFQERWHIFKKICLGDLPPCFPHVLDCTDQASCCQWLWQIPWTSFIVSKLIRDFLKAGRDRALCAVKTLAESGSLRVIFHLVHLNLSWIPSLSTLPLICITLCGHIILAHYAKNNVDSISLAQNMQRWHITFENQGN